MDANLNYEGRVNFNIPNMIENFVKNKSNRTSDGSTYKTYLNTRPMSQSGANETRDCTVVCLKLTYVVSAHNLKNVSTFGRQEFLEILKNVSTFGVSTLSTPLYI